MVRAPGEPETLPVTPAPVMYTLSPATWKLQEELDPAQPVCVKTPEGASVVFLCIFIESVVCLNIL